MSGRGLAPAPQTQSSKHNLFFLLAARRDNSRPAPNRNNPIIAFK